MPKLRRTVLVLCACCALLTLGQIARADTELFKFEDLPDLTIVDNFYAAKGVHFLNAISLTAGFSLNEIDFPPHSGFRVVADNGPLGFFDVWFDSPVTDMSAYFTHGSALTLTFFSDPTFASPIGTSFDTGANLGSQIQLSYAGPFQAFRAQVAVPESLAMDDLQFTAPVPEPSSIALFGAILAGLGGLRLLKRRSRGFATRIPLVLGCVCLLATSALADRGVYNSRTAPSETLISTPTNITFTAEVGADPTTPLLPGSVSLYETTAEGAMLGLIGPMYDNGTHGDVVAADTIFTTQLTINQFQPGTRYFRVSVAYSGVRNRSLGAVLPVTVYAPLPPNLVPQIVAVLQGFQNTFTGQIAQLGLDGARTAALLAALNNPNIGPGNASLQGADLSIRYLFRDPVTGNLFTIWGIGILGDPNQPTDGAGRSVPSNLPINYKSPGSDSLLLFGPGYQAADAQNAIMDHAAAQFNDTEYMTFTPSPPAITARDSASLELVKQWGNYGTVIVHTHGGYWSLGGVNQVVLLTGTAATAANQATYQLDLQANRVGISTTGLYAFAPSFVTTYVPSMKDTFLYLGACESLRDDSMWNALRAKGAKVAFGWSQTVNRGFNGTTFSSLVDPMLPHTNPPNPLSALAAFNAIPNRTDPFGGHNATLWMRTASAEWNNFFFTLGGIVNGDFETGDWSGWTHGGALSTGQNFQLVVGARKHGGSWSGALGRWDTSFQGYNPTLEPSGYEWFYQDFVVPSNATSLSFWWWLETYDTAQWDWFDAYLQNTSGQTLKTLVYHGGKPGSNYGPYWNTGGWQYVAADVTAYRGQKVRIYFDQRLDGYGDQQRVYVDDVKVQ